MREQALQSDTLRTLEVWTRVHSQQLMKPSASDVMQLIDLLDKTLHKWKMISNENTRLSGLNARLERQMDNYERALDESKESVRRLESDLAAANSQIDSLQSELHNYQLLFQAANSEIQNAAAHKPNGQCLTETAVATRENQHRIKRRSSSPQLSSGKRTKRVHEGFDEELEADEKFIVSSTAAGDADCGKGTHALLPPVLANTPSRLPVRLPPLVPLVSNTPSVPLSITPRPQRRSVSEPRGLPPAAVNTNCDNASLPPFNALLPLKPTKLHFDSSLMDYSEPQGQEWNHQGRPIHRSVHQFMESGYSTSGDHPDVDTPMMANNSILGPITCTPHYAQVDKSRLISRMKRREAPFFEKPY